MYKESSKYWFPIFLIVALYISYNIIHNFIITLLSSMVLAFIFYPAYKFIKSKLKNETASAIASTLIVIILFSIPLIITINAVAHESYTIYNGFIKGNNIQILFEKECKDQTIVCKWINAGRAKLSDPEIKPIIIDSVKEASSFFISASSNFLLSLPQRILNFFILFFSLFYFFKQGPQIVSFVKKLIPLTPAHQEEMVAQIGEKTKSIILGYIIIALLQGFLAGIGFFLFGISNPIMWALMVTLCSIIPFFGTSLVWVPLSLYSIATAITNSTSPISGIGLFLYGWLIISTADNLVRPKIMGDIAKIHPLIVLLGVMGGLKFFGFMGFIIGPIALMVTISLLEIYVKEK